MIRRRGYNGFSYADLARAVGIRTATIHYYFATKKDLGVQLIASYDARYDEALAKIAASTADGAQRIACYADLYLNGLERELGCLCAVLAITPDFLPSEMRDAVGLFFKKHYLWLERVLSEGVADGSIRRDIDPSAHARLIISVLEGGLLLERMLDGPHGFQSTITALQSQLVAR